MSAQQTVGELRTLVTRRAGLRRRVALLSSDAAMRAALEQNGCTVLVDPEGLEALEAFAPEVVVAFDGLLSSGADGLRALARAAPNAELVLSFANAASSSVLLRALLGATPPHTTSEPDVRTWLREAGWSVVSRDVVVTPHQPSGLSADTESALRQLFEQLNPDAAADRLLVMARRGVEATPPEREAGLTSVVISGDDEAALEGTVRSVAGQLHQPLELVVVATCAEPRLEELVKAARGRAGLSLTLVGGGPVDALARTNRGLALARGQFVCCVEAGELLERTHVGALVRQLEHSTAAWALAPVAGLGAPFELRAWLEAGAVHRGRWLLDRARLGSFPLQFAEGVELGEAMLLCRLAALFPPALVAGPPTLDSARRPASAPAGLLEVLAARPLRTLGSLAETIRPPPRVPLASLVEERLGEKNARAARLFGEARGLLERVRHAAEEAREAGRRELEKKKKD
ncbi:MAG: hypothetical protein ACOZQL_43365 [Myxococcota bacterium]